FLNTEKVLWLRSEKPGKRLSYLLTRVNIAISVSNNTKKNVELKQREKVRVIYNFLETSSGLQVRVNEQKRITIAGSIQPIKGQKDAIKAIALLSQQYTLNIIGRVVDQNYYNELLKLIKKHKLEERVFFT